MENNFRNISLNSVIYLAGEVFTKASVFFLIPLYTQVLSPTEYGDWAILLSLISLAGILFPLQLGSSLTIEYYKLDDDSQRDFVATLMVTVLLTSTLFFIIFDIFLKTWILSAFVNLKEIDYKLALGICFFAALLVVPQTLLRLNQRSKLAVLISSGPYLLGLILGVFLLKYFNMGITGLLLGSLSSNCISSVLHILAVWKNLTWKYSIKMALASILVSSPIMLHMLSHWGLNLMDRLMLQYYVPLSQVGVYQLGYQLGTVFQVVVLALNASWTPYFMKNFYRDKQKNNIRLFSTILVLLMLWVALGLVLFLPVMSRWVVEVSYYDALPIIPWVISGFLFVGYYQFWVNILLYHRKTVTVSLITAASAIVNFSLNAVLIPYYGYIAAAINTMVSYFVLACLTRMAVGEIGNTVFDVRRWSKGACVAIVLYIMPWIFGEYFGDNVTMLLISGIVVLIYPLILWRMKIFGQDEVRVFKDLYNAA